MPDEFIKINLREVFASLPIMNCRKNDQFQVLQLVKLLTQMGKPCHRD